MERAVLNPQAQRPSEANPAELPLGRAAVRLLRRLAKLVAVAVVGMALMILGGVWLIQGILDHRPLSAVAGGLLLAGLIGAFLTVTARSRRQVRAGVATYDARLRAGLRTCTKCRIEFEEATAPTTTRPWQHTAL